MVLQHELSLSSDQVRDMSLEEFERWVAYLEMRGIIKKRGK